MHGRPRKPPTQEEQEASSLKAKKLRHLQSQVLHFHHSKIYTKESIEVSAKLLESNPEHYTGWNYRKLAVQYLLNHQKNEDDTESIESIIDEELRLVENALKRNFKSYGAWHHRKWVLSMGHSSTERELRLLGKLQKMDPRNFHAWNYRRFIAGLRKIPDEEELKYTTDMIYDNFSNYSAWHNRSMLLSNLLEKGEEGYNKENVFGEEYEFVRNALFTDPDDQSGWFYHLWLLDQTLKREPLLLSCWPPHGSNIYLSLEGCCLRDTSSQPVLHFQSKARNFPIILYFNEAVNGVSSSTVTIECDFHSGDDFIWKPLSANKSGFSRAWLAHLGLHNDVHELDTFPVKVTVAQFPGITSSDGTPCLTACRASFIVSLYSSGPRNSDLQTEHRRISWQEENFSDHTAKCRESNFFHSLLNFEFTKETKPTTPEWSMETISNEISHCKELLSTTDCKIGTLTLARLLTALSTLTSYNGAKNGIEVNYDDVLALYQNLMKMDPVHICYYEDAYSLVLWKQMTSNVESLLKYCYEYQEPSSPSANPGLSVRLNSLSLSRIGSMEHLLWVQMLDLSHNKLHSIEGLEALQLLSCLKLSNNQFCSFTALEPLKSLKSLEVLDISYNEIGAHSIDTRRYLSSSPLTHAAGEDWQFDDFTSDHWDAYLLFKDMNLIQLEIMGNAVVDEHLTAFLLTLLPGLKWLDSEKCH